MAYTTIDDPTKFFSTNLWVADNASSRSLTGFGHQPDLVWTKHRGSGATNPTFTDSVRGGDKQMGTSSNAAEDSGSHGKISSFDSDGITVIDGTNGTYPRLYFNSLNPFGASVGGNYVGWSWKAGGTAVSNGNGSITSSVSANTTSGVSIVSYTGTGSVATVGHGLGVAPKFIIVKTRSLSGEAWPVDSRAASGILYLNETGTKGSYGDSSPFPSTAPTTTVFSIGTPNNTNGSGATYIAYCFAEVKGFSKFGSYTGNGNADGTFVYTGFRPAFVMIKNTSSSGTDWVMHDSARDPFNVIGERLIANGTNAGSTATYLDFLSNGFKWRTSDFGRNENGSTFIYMAFAEHPFVTEGTKAAGTAR